MIPREYNDGPDVTYISCRWRMGGRGGACSSSQVAARYSFVAGREFRRCKMLNEAIGERGLTSIGMLNVACRWNKEPVLFSHLRTA